MYREKRGRPSLTIARTIFPSRIRPEIGPRLGGINHSVGRYHLVDYVDGGQ